MKPYHIISTETKEVLKECDSFSEGWDTIKGMHECDLVRTDNNAVLAHKGKKVDTTVPLIFLVNTGAPITTSN
jgi:hypothetical protein